MVPPRIFADVSKIARWMLHLSHHFHQYQLILAIIVASIILTTALYGSRRAPIVVPSPQAVARIA